MAVPAGNAVRIFGPRALAFSSAGFTPLLYAGLPILATWNYQPFLPVFLLSIIGAGGVIAINSRATELEELTCKPIMPMFHAAFSIGGVIGSLIYAVLTAFGGRWSIIFPCLELCVSVVAIFAAWFMDVGLSVNRPTWGDDIDELQLPLTERATTLHRRILALAALGATNCCVMIAEGAIGDWTGLYLREVVGVRPSFQPLGYAAFAAAMCIFRLCGTTAIIHFGRKQVFTAGSATAACGLLLMIYWPIQLVVYPSCFLIGCGMSNLVPLIMSTAGIWAPRKYTSVAIACVSVLAEFGLLSGPALIGVLTLRSGSLRWALLLLPCLSLLTTCIGYFIIPN